MAPSSLTEELPPLSRRAYSHASNASSWEEIWEAGPYYERISELLEDARHYAIFVGWQIDSRLPLKRPFRPERDAPGTDLRETLKQKVLRLCESKPDFHLYFLMWDHAYFYIIERETWQGRIWEDVHPHVHFIFDNRHPFGGSHHEKIVIVDGKVAFCGGIDLCDERWDSPQHLFFDPRRSLSWKHEHHGPYHDLAVQVTGPVCAELQEHVARRWRAISSVPFPDPPPEQLAAIHGGHRVYVSRTLANVDVGFKGIPIVREIEFLFRDLIRKAQKRIVFEGQYYWSRDVNDVLVSKIQEMKGRDFEVIIILADIGKLRSLTKEMAYHELLLLQKLELAAQQAGTRLLMGTPNVLPTEDEMRKAGPKPVYIHSKAIVVDDRFLSIGSANLAARALRYDSEVTLTYEARNEAERAHIRHFAETLFSHWGLQPDSPTQEEPRSDLKIRRYYPSFELREIGRIPLRRAILTWIPWQRFFDPEVPYFYPFAWRFRKLARTNGQLVALMVFLVWLAGSLVAAGVGRLLQPTHVNSWTAVAGCVLLSSVWLLPIPFLFVALLTVFRLGPETASVVAVVSFWIAAIWGYSVTRFFPTASTTFYRRTGPRWLPGTLGLRSFPKLVSVLADPRVSLRTKIAYQGLYSIPSPWFILGTLVVLPGVVQVFVLWAGRAALWALPPAVEVWLYRYSPVLLLLTLGAAVARVLLSKPWKSGI